MKATGKNVTMKDVNAYCLSDLPVKSVDTKCKDCKKTKRFDRAPKWTPQNEYVQMWKMGVCSCNGKKEHFFVAVDQSIEQISYPALKMVIQRQKAGQTADEEVPVRQPRRQQPTRRKRESAKKDASEEEVSDRESLKEEATEDTAPRRRAPQRQAPKRFE